MTRLFLLVLVFFATSISVFPRSPRRDSIHVQNNSSQTLIVATEVRGYPASVDPRIFPTWLENIKSVYFIIADPLRAGERRVEPNRTVTIALFDVDIHEWEMIDQTPSLDLIKSIFRSLRIVTEDGSKVVTLDNLGEQIIRRSTWEGGRTTFHTIMVFDYDEEVQE